MDEPDAIYGDYTRGNAGQVGRPVTKWFPSGIYRILKANGFTDEFLEYHEIDEWLPIVIWEPHPDDA